VPSRLYVNDVRPLNSRVPNGPTGQVLEAGAGLSVLNDVND